jgi:hypothetical protein
MTSFTTIIIGRGRIPYHGPTSEVKLAIMFSKLSPKNNATSKAEYTNTQQGLPG